MLVLQAIPVAIAASAALNHCGKTRKVSDASKRRRHPSKRGGDSSGRRKSSRSRKGGSSKSTHTAKSKSRSRKSSHRKGSSKGSKKESSKVKKDKDHSKKSKSSKSKKGSKSKRSSKGSKKGSRSKKGSKKECSTKTAKASATSLQLSSQDLKFKSYGGLQTIAIQNKDNVPRAFKVGLTLYLAVLQIKCSDNLLYRVAPVYGTISANDKVTLNVLRNNGAAKVDKIVVLSVKTDDPNRAAEEVMKNPDTQNIDMVVLPLIAAN